MAKTKRKGSGKNKKTIKPVKSSKIDTSCIIEKKQKNRKARRLGLFVFALMLFFVSFNYGGSRNGFPTASAPGVDSEVKKTDYSLKENYSSAELLLSKEFQKPQIFRDETFEINAKSYLVLDRESLTPLLEKNTNAKELIASVTKIMTAVVALENSSLNDTVEVKQSFEGVPNGKMGLFWGEKISVENVLRGLLISSANDAAEALAYHIGKGNYSVFIELMNKKAQELGLKNTHFTNAIGLDNKFNYSTAYDMALLANYALKNEFIAETAQTQELTVTSLDGASKHVLSTTNDLLKDPDLTVYGLKTGQTPLALGCLVSLAKTKNGEEIITVILGSYDRFKETKEMIEWVEENIGWE